MLNFSLSELIQPETRITILDVGASMTEKPPYAHLIASGLVRLIGFEPNQAECERLREHYGKPHEFGELMPLECPANRAGAVLQPLGGFGWLLIPARAESPSAGKFDDQ